MTRRALECAGGRYPESVSGWELDLLLGPAVRAGLGTRERRRHRLGRHPAHGAGRPLEPLLRVPARLRDRPRARSPAGSQRTSASNGICALSGARRSLSRNPPGAGARPAPSDCLTLCPSGRARGSRNHTCGATSRESPQARASPPSPLSRRKRASPACAGPAATRARLVQLQIGHADHFPGRRRNHRRDESYRGMSRLPHQCMAPVREQSAGQAAAYFNMPDSRRKPGIQPV